MLLCSSLVVVVFLTLQVFADPQQCGLFDSQCQSSVSSNDYDETAITVTGYLTGAINVIVSTFSDDTCKTPLLDIALNGTWLDLGQLDASDASSRHWQVTYTQVTATPHTENAANQLNTACPCGGSWKPETSRFLYTCPKGTCTDTSWMGGLHKTASSKGITIGAPAYGLSTVNGNNISISYLDAMYTTGMNLKPVVDVWTTSPRQESCGNVTHDGNFCGMWNLGCSPNLVDNAVASDSSLYYEGPTHDELFMTGVFRQEDTYYSDSGCMNRLYSVVQKGTLGSIKSIKSIEGARLIGTGAPFTLITPHTKATVERFKEECPCGSHSTWKMGETRRITSCPLNTCNFDWVNNITFNTDGTYYRDLLKSTRDDSLPELQSTFSAGNQIAPSAFTPADLHHPYLFTPNTCKYPYDYVLDICGKWKDTCSAEPIGDVVTTLTFTGSAGDASQGTGTGTIARQRNIFPVSSACYGHADMEIVENGYWSDMGNQTTTIEGARQISVNYVYTLVSVFTDKLAAQFNNHYIGCPCGGLWGKDIPRILTTCPPGTCPDKLGVFGAGAIGTPGYGIIRDQDLAIRMSSLHEKEEDGFTEYLQLSDFPLDYDGECDPGTYNDDFVGDWLRTCSGDNSNYDFDASFEIDSKSRINLTMTFYQADEGCHSDEQLSIVQIGKMKTHGPAPDVPHASQMEMDISSATVTPYTQAALNSLNQQCPCSVGASIWTLGKSTTINHACPANTCDGFDILRTPFGGVTYGIALRNGYFMRFSEFYRDQQAGYNQVFDNTDFYFVYKEIPVGPSPSSSKMSGGGVLLLIAFFGMLTYFLVGMAWNYKQSGVPVLPHVGFWKGLPSLISDGWEFTKSKIGMSSRSGSYKNIVNPSSDQSSKGGYNTL
eukprot:m.178060 g.178060  ORF g.178060 m.178060 type:complete len:886 (-) comp13553_c1_seq6:209-2866(-)